MIPRIKSLAAMENFLLAVEFDDGHKVIYDVKEDIETLPTFRALADVYGLFNQVQLDESRTCVYWNDEIDLASDCIYEYGVAA
ncbi:MAG: DUF2442 domain-containing protein [Prevotellaceae bacterium]|nr:DUF2442 domain-containing protein [Prevotellaceae bacterium]MDO4992419.1 DUF2442 domain-containing protein [Prevotellaceae bacterium]